MGNEKNIPQELISKILLKLPVKSVTRFKCASKSLLSLISDPLFAKSHYQVSASPTHFLISLESSIPSLEPSPSQALAIDLDAASLANDDSVAVTKFHLQWFRGYNIRGCCRGFLLLENYPFLSLWNPSTNAFKETSCYPFPLNRSKFVFGFGYHDSTDDYLVFVAWINFPTIIPSIVLEIYSARAGSWRVIELPNFLYSILNYQKPGLFYNGAIHRLVRGLPEKTILALDLETTTLSTIPFPSDVLVRRNLDDEDYFSVSSVTREAAIYDLKEIGGCLSLFCGGESVEIWVMKEYRVESSWTKYFYMEEVSVGEFYPIYITKGGEYVGLDESDDLVKLNDKGELLEGACYEDDQIALYTPSLFSLPPPYFQEEEDGGKQEQQLARRIKGTKFKLRMRKVKRSKKFKV